MLAKGVPEPVVLKHDCAVKGLKLSSDAHELFIGLESGHIRIVDSDSFEVIKEVKHLLQEPILKID